MNKTVISGICGVFILIMLAAASAVWIASDEPSYHSPENHRAVDNKADSATLIVELPGQTSAGGGPMTGQRDAHHAWLTAATRDTFDHFLLLFEDGEAQMWSAFEQYCEPLEYCSELTELFSRYLLYKQALQELDTGNAGLSASEMEQRIYDKQGLYQQFFTVHEIDVLFSAELAWDTNALARRQIVEDSTLSQKQKQSLLKAHFDALPTDLKKAVEPTMQLNELSELVDSEQASFNQLASTFGTATATRLTTMLQHQSDWKQRVQEYLNARETLLARYATDPEYAEAQMKEIQESMFTATERRRLMVFVENPSLLED